MPRLARRNKKLKKLKIYIMTKIQKTIAQYVPTKNKQSINKPTFIPSSMSYEGYIYNCEIFGIANVDKVLNELHKNNYKYSLI